MFEETQGGGQMIRLFIQEHPERGDEIVRQIDEPIDEIEGIDQQLKAMQMGWA